MYLFILLFTGLFKNGFQAFQILHPIWSNTFPPKTVTYIPEQIIIQKIYYNQKPVNDLI